MEMYICHDCAKAHDGVWPSDHVATWHVGKCEVCRKEKPIVSSRHYRFPPGTAIRYTKDKK